jgi:hypothetical protein
MVVLAALTRTWRNAVLLVKLETILRWHTSRVPPVLAQEVNRDAHESSAWLRHHRAHSAHGARQQTLGQ